MIDLLELGDVAAVDLEIAAFASLAEERRQPSNLWYVHLYRAMRLLLAGRYEEAERESRAGYELGQRVGDTNAHQGFTLQMIALRRDRGWSPGVEEDIRENIARYPSIPGWRCLLAYLLNAVGRPDESRSELEQLAVDGFATIPRDGIWLGAISHLAELVAALEDRAHAATLYDLLLPFRDRNLTIGWALELYRSASRPLGQLAALLERRDDAVRHFEQAMAMNERMGAHPWLARTCVDYGQFLLDQPENGERTRGIELLRQGLADARRLDMAPLIERTTPLLGVGRVR